MHIVNKDVKIGDRVKAKWKEERRKNGNKKVMVLGAGTMGAGVAQVFAASDFTVLLKDLNRELAEKGIKNIERGLSKLIEKGKITQDVKDGISSRIKVITDYKEVEDVDLILEAIFENMELKKEVFDTLDKICKEETIFATNTSSLSVTEIASSTKRQDKIIGMHFFNPAPIMKLIEIIKGFHTSDEVVEIIKDLSIKLGKTPVIVQDSPGFATSRFIMVMINEAICALSEGVASAKDIDTAMKLGMNHPMGPLELADLIGLDVCLNVMNTLYQNFNDPKYRPSYLLKKMVSAGNLGRKTKKGFYEYGG